MSQVLLLVLPNATEVESNSKLMSHLSTTMQMLAWDKIGVANVPGELALICGLLMWVTSIPRFRRKMFELFYYTHHLYFLFLFFFVLHVGIAFFCYILPGVYLFLVDRCLRFLQSRCKVRLVSARVLPCEAVELTFTKNPGE